jgi:hypothetical protein
MRESGEGSDMARGLWGNYGVLKTDYLVLR